MSRKPKEKSRVARRRPVARKRRARQSEPTQAKVSIAIPAEEIEWAKAHAERLHCSVSSVFAEGLALYKRRYDLGKLLEVLGGTDDITDEIRAEVDAEFREAGIIP